MFSKNKSKRIFFVLSTMLLAFQTAAYADSAELLKKAKRQIQRAERQMDIIEKRVTRPDLPPTMIASWKKKLSKAEELLEEADALLDQVGEGVAEQSLLEAAKARADMLNQEIAKRESAVASATSKATGAEGQQAVKDYQNLAARLRSVDAWLRDSSDTPRMMEAYSQSLKAREALDEKFQEALSTSSPETFDLQAAAREAEMAEQSVQSTIKHAQKHYPAWIEKELKTATENAADLQKRGVYQGWETSVQRHFAQADLRYRKLKAVAPQAAASVGQKVESTRRSLESTQKAFRAQVVAANKVPADIYRGGDAAAIKQKVRQVWAQKFPQDQVTRVVIASANWSAFSGTDWVSSARRWQDYNFDRLETYIVVNGGGSYNYKFFAHVVRQNLEGGRLDVFCDRPDNPEERVDTLLAK